LPGNCCLVARQRLSPSGGYRQPVKHHLAEVY